VYYDLVLENLILKFKLMKRFSWEAWVFKIFNMDFVRLIEFYCLNDSSKTKVENINSVSVSGVYFV